MKRLAFSLTLLAIAASICFASTYPEGIQLQSHQWSITNINDRSQTIAVTGVIRNTSVDVWYSSVTIEISILKRSDNTKVQTQRSTTKNFAPGDVWKFKPVNDITVKLSDNFTNNNYYRVDRITAIPMQR